MPGMTHQNRKAAVLQQAQLCNSGDNREQPLQLCLVSVVWQILHVVARKRGHV